MANAKENGESRCFTAILRHLLCWHGTSTHLGSDRFTPTGQCPEGEAKVGGGKDELDSTSSSGRRAGVVARLMGLETLPDAKWVPVLKSPDLFLRSRSAILMDYLLEVNLSSQQARRHPHRRIRTSASFCEAPVKVLTSGPQPKENNFMVVIMKNRDEPARTEMKMQGKSRTNEVQRRKKKKKKKTSDCWRDERRTRSRAGCNSESRRTNNVRAAYEKKCGSMDCKMRKSQERDVERGDSPDCSRPVSICDHLKHRPQEGKTVDSAAMQAPRILDPVIVRKKKAAMKKEEVIKFSESGKRMDDTVKKAHELAGAEAGKSRQFSPGSSDREEICVMIEGHILDCLLEEFATV